MTMKCFRFPVGSGTGAPAPPWTMDSCVAFADASSISRFEIVLSSVLIDHRAKQFDRNRWYSILLNADCCTSRARLG